MFSVNIEKATLQNDKYRHVLATVPNNMQLVLMCLEPQEDIPFEVHPDITQFIKVESGIGEITTPSGSISISDGWASIISPGVSHRVRNISPTQSLKLYTIYTPIEHDPSTIQRRQ